MFGGSYLCVFNLISYNIFHVCLPAIAFWLKIFQPGGGPLTSCSGQYWNVIITSKNVNEETVRRHTNKQKTKMKKKWIKKRFNVNNKIRIGRSLNENLMLMIPMARELYLLLICLPNPWLSCFFKIFVHYSYRNGKRKWLQIAILHN